MDSYAGLNIVDPEYGPAIAAAQKLLTEGCRISVLSILEELPSYIGSYFPEDPMQKSIEGVSEELRNEFGSEEVDIHVDAGHSTNSILSWQKQHELDCVIVFSRRPGFSGLFLGSTAARVVRHANCSAVLLR